jgi:nucleoside-diphosphate-sugar epimerase
MSGLTLLTGATGYVGGRLLSLLQRQNVNVRCLTRRPEALEDRLSPTTEIIFVFPVEIRAIFRDQCELHQPTMPLLCEPSMQMVGRLKKYNHGGVSMS